MATYNLTRRYINLQVDFNFKDMLKFYKASYIFTRPVKNLQVDL